MVMFTPMTSHYQVWAERNQDSWVLSEDYFNFWSTQIAQKLNVQAGETLCDIGAGTGRIANQIALKTKAKIICIEPQTEMAQMAEALGLSVISLNGEAYCTAAAESMCDRILIKQAFHHLVSSRPETLLSAMYRMLRPGGAGLILTMPPTILYPMFEAARRQFEKTQLNQEVLYQQLKQAGFHVAEGVIDYPVELSKEKFFQNIRSRFISTLSDFSEAEIEAGIQEIRYQHGDPDTYTFNDRLHSVLFTKPS